jgi:hypothetical protein
MARLAQSTKQRNRGCFNLVSRHRTSSVDPTAHQKSKLTLRLCGALVAVPNGTKARIKKEARRIMVINISAVEGKIWVDTTKK